MPAGGDDHAGSNRTSRPAATSSPIEKLVRKATPAPASVAARHVGAVSARNPELKRAIRLPPRVLSSGATSGFCNADIPTKGSLTTASSVVGLPHCAANPGLATSHL